MPRDLGDFQTPFPLIKDITTYLAALDKNWTRALEPTCGQGNFIHGLLASDMHLQEIQGIELQAVYAKQANRLISTKKPVSVTIKQANIFDIDLRTDLSWRENGKLLVIGNPPWITSAELSTLQSNNIPAKTNFKKLSGFDAMTGASNFDIAEYIILKLIHELSLVQPTIAMLCKTSVARNILQFAAHTNLPISSACVRKINSKEHFGAMVDACLFYLDIGLEQRCYQAEIYPDLYASEPTSVMGMVKGKLVSNISTSKHVASLDGLCPLVWRQGIKHDAASVIELTYDSAGQLVNKLGETVDVEQEYVYPLLKSSDLGGKEKERPKRAVIVTQHYVGEDTLYLRDVAPKLWQYLEERKSTFDKRKSSIYEQQPPFAMFGIGAYSFVPYKVAISGLYKTLKFSLIGPVNDHPVMFDDTCYFVPCSSAQQASFVLSLLNDDLCYDFFQSIIFWDAKRPITKKILQRINLDALLVQVDKQLLLTRASNILRLAYSVDEFWPDDLGVLLQECTLDKASHRPKLSGSLPVTQMNLLDA